MNPLHDAWNLLKERDNHLERLTQHLEHSSRNEEGLEHQMQKVTGMMQGIADGHDLSLEQVDAALGIHILTPPDTPTDLDADTMSSIQEMMHDLLDIHTAQDTGIGGGAHHRDEITPDARVTTHPRERTPHCEACDDGDDVRFAGTDPDTGEHIYVCTYNHRNRGDLHGANPTYMDSENRYWMGESGDGVVPLEDSGAHNTAAERPEWGSPRQMTERGIRRYTNRTGEEEDTVRGLAAPLTAASQGEGRVGPDVMDENQLIRYRAPQLREMIQHISQELARRG
tara:strand:- start:47290 stop:48138 length:849 start_codon:yes stop_codon:yes gene_type:complete